MANFTNLKLAQALAAEEEEDELDRIMAQQASTEEAPVEPITDQPNGFDTQLQDLLEDDQVEPVEPQVGTAGQPPKSPAIGRKGVPNPHLGTPRARATERDAVLLNHLAVFRCASVETLSLLQLAAFNPLTQKTSGKLTSAYTTRERLLKLRKLGMVVTQTNPVNGEELWGATERGIARAQGFGYMQEEWAASWEGLQGMGFAAMNHFSVASMVAAQFISPIGFFRKSLNIEPVKADQVISEASIRRAQMPIKDQLFEASTVDDKKDFGSWRAVQVERVMRELTSGKLAYDEILELNPALWTLGLPPTEVPTKQTHWPDLILSFEENRTAARSSSIAVEIELSNKAWDEHEAILRTFDAETATPLIYSRVVYIVSSTAIEKRLKKVDEKLGLGLIESGRLKVLPLKDRNGTSVHVKRRVGD